MCSKKKLVLSICLIWLPVMSYAQMLGNSIGDSLEIEFSKADKITAIGGSLGLAMGSKSQLSLGAAFGFFDFASDLEIPPEPIVEIGIQSHTTELSGVTLFGTWTLGGSRREMIFDMRTDLEGWVKFTHGTTNLRLSPGIGIFKEFQTESGLTIRPFAEIAFNYYWIWDISKSRRKIYSRGRDTEEDFTGEIGIDLDISSTSTLSVSYDFILRDRRLLGDTSLGSYSWVRMALNFH